MSTEQSIESSQCIESPQFPLGIERDIENARVLLEDSPWRDNPQKYRKTAEAILRRILAVDAENTRVKSLLLKAEEPPPAPEPVAAAPEPPRAEAVYDRPAPIPRQG